jgi:glycosyltransferase involved in cell wall biosynthesis
MQNILYIGPYKENNGLGRSSRRYLKSLSLHKNINLSCRPIYFTNQIQLEGGETDFIQPYEINQSSKYDCIIQHGYPDMFEYNKAFGKNIGITEIHTENLKHTGWIEKCNLMDEILVGSIFAAESLFKSNINTTVNVVPEPYNLDVFDNPEFKNFFADSDNQPFTFYTIGQYTEKKNINGIILAFLLEFTHKDNVRLFIKTGSNSLESITLENQMQYELSKIYQSIRKAPNDKNKIDIINGPLDNETIIRLHKSCDCYVDAVRADSNAACAIEALLCDNLVITNKNIASNSFINNLNGLVTDSIKSNVYTSDYFAKHTFTIYEEWHEPIIGSLQNKMREAYEMSEMNKKQKISLYNKSQFNNLNISEKLYEYSF